MAKKHKNSEYWEDRIANETWRAYNDAEEQNRDMLQMYEKTSSSIKKELYSLGELAEEQGGLTRTQQYRFNKLLGNQGVIFQEIEKLGDKVDKTQSNRIKDAGKQVYGNVMNELGVDEFNYPNKKEMEQMLRSPWHGSFFSKRLWENMSKLKRNLNGVINSGVATGKTTTEMAIQLSNIMNKTFNEAHRLVRTETINYMNRSALRGYKDAGVSKVQWWAAKDERTCEICGTNHEREYGIDKAPILPCHPGCRCTWLPVIDDIRKQTPELTDDEIGAINKYVSPDAYVFNEKLRNEEKLTKEEEICIKSLDNALDKLPSINGIVQRSLYFSFKEDRVNFVKAHKKEAIINYKQYLSSSLNEVYNEDGDIQLIIFSKNGKDIRKYNPNEHEVLFKRESKFKVTDIVDEDGKTYIYLMEASDE